MSVAGHVENVALPYIPKDEREGARALFIALVLPGRMLMRGLVARRR